MTRGVFATVHGHFVRAAALNPGSLLLVVASGVGAVVLVVLLATGRRPRVSVPTWLPLAVVGTLWAFQLFKYATGRPL
jgi:hypothetical protein